MGLIRSSFSFSMGALVGVYIAQNYNVPNIQGLINTGLAMAKQMEHAYRKPSNKKKPPADDDTDYLSVGRDGFVTQLHE
ncbi:hypothetical protein O6H91_07G021900 [Diphasiastrum complanatum]|uniref:Uncharacterized protein n=1 Tax=Diphasiastrum complanatum TaxID=34168 RepID=A0ACC2D376_DIPCM|nr:hypothetical protein O6H91_07G021900 [Diphasiastrum complanatum]